MAESRYNEGNPLAHLEATENEIVLFLKKRVENYASFDEILDNFQNPESFGIVISALNRLVRRGLLTQFRAMYDGRVQNHYRLAE